MQTIDEMRARAAAATLAPHRLYWLAAVADAVLNEVLDAHTSGRRNRVTMTAADLLVDAVRTALENKLRADEAWLSYMRTRVVLRNDLHCEHHHALSEYHGLEDGVGHRLLCPTCDAGYIVELLQQRASEVHIAFAAR